MGFFEAITRRKAPKSAESRANIENPTVPVSADNFLAYFGVNGGNLSAVTIDTALKVPAVLAAVAFLSRTMASLPRHAYRDSKTGPKRVSGSLQSVLNSAPNENFGAFQFWQLFWQQVFTGGRGLAWIERTPQGIYALWTLDPKKTSISVRNGLKVYKFDGKEYPSADVIDVPFMLKSDGVSHWGPIARASDAIQLALAMTEYGANFFAGGGVPPLVLEGPLPAGPDAIHRAQQDIKTAVNAAKNASEPVFPIPPGYKLNPVGIDPAKGQMVEARRFQVEEIARAFQLPPVFLQDLSRATFNNSEQQDLFLVKHLIGQWATALEDELNLKLFGWGSTGRYVKHNLDGLLRGDFKSRMDGYGIAIQNGIRTPDEVRGLEELPAKGGEADKLHIQGGTVPLGQQKMQGGSEDPPPANDNQPDDNEAGKAA